MNGKNSNGAAFSAEQLNDRLSTINHALRRADLPTELPNAEEMSAEDVRRAHSERVYPVGNGEIERLKPPKFSPAAQKLK